MSRLDLLTFFNHEGRVAAIAHSQPIGTINTKGTTIWIKRSRGQLDKPMETSSIAYFTGQIYLEKAIRRFTEDWKASRSKDSYQLYQRQTTRWNEYTESLQSHYSRTRLIVLFGNTNTALLLAGGSQLKLTKKQCKMRVEGYRLSLSSQTCTYVRHALALC